MTNALDALDDMALSVLYWTTLNPLPAASAWKGLDRTVQKRLMAKGYLEPPHGRSRRTVLTAKGIQSAQAVCRKHLDLKALEPSTTLSGPAAEDQPLQVINCMIAILRPLPPMLAWLHTLPDDAMPATLEELQDDLTALLIPELYSNEEAQAYVESLYEFLFEFELAEWDRRMELWPQDRTLTSFREWFTVEIHSVVIDLMDGPVEKEDY